MYLVNEKKVHSVGGAAKVSKMGGQWQDSREVAGRILNLESTTLQGHFSLGNRGTT